MLVRVFANSKKRLRFIAQFCSFSATNENQIALAFHKLHNACADESRSVGIAVIAASAVRRR
jgi:hypothetical protein